VDTDDADNLVAVDELPITQLTVNNTGETRRRFRRSVRDDGGNLDDSTFDSYGTPASHRAGRVRRHRGAANADPAPRNQHRITPAGGSKKAS